jgi:hypothetical protein
VEIYLFILSYGMEPEGCGLIRIKKEESKARKAKQKKIKKNRENMMDAPSQGVTRLNV